MLLLLACAGTRAPEDAPVEILPGPPSSERLVFEPAVDRSSPALWVDGIRHPLSYRVFAEDGQEIGGQPFGQLVTIDGEPIGQCNSQDFAALIVVDQVVFHLSHVECQPGAIYLTRMDADMNPVSTRPIDMSGVRGTMLPCSGDLTPWNTLLSSEEYEPNARKAVPGEGVSDNWQGFNRMGNYFPDGLASVNPYDYGWMPEVAVLDAQGNTSVVKHFSMGRFSHELGIVAPDSRTVYLSDDGYNVGFYRFVADTAEDLSAGTLYAARFQEGRVEWISLGHAQDEDIDTSLHFDDLFSVDEEGCTPVLTQHGDECLRVKEGMERQASRLETRRYAAVLGATTEFSKAEGLAIDEGRKTLYLALTKVQEGMLPRHTGWEPGRPDHIQFNANGCGAILAFDLDEEWVAGTTSVSVALAGRPMGPVCDPSFIAGPDNITMLGDLLMIAEDTRGHDPNILWAWDADDDSLTPVVRAEPGAEMAGIHHYPEVGWFTVTEQHSARGDEPSKSALLGPLPDL